MIKYLLASIVLLSACNKDVTLPEDNIVDSVKVTATVPTLTPAPDYDSLVGKYVEQHAAILFDSVWLTEWYVDSVKYDNKKINHFGRIARYFGNFMLHEVDDTHVRTLWFQQDTTCVYNKFTLFTAHVVIYGGNQPLTFTGRLQFTEPSGATHTWQPLKPEYVRIYLTRRAKL